MLILPNLKRQQNKHIDKSNKYKYNKKKKNYLQWPYCDGAHGRHNNATGDNVGPLVITKTK